MISVSRTKERIKKRKRERERAKERDTERESEENIKSATKLNPRMTEIFLQPKIRIFKTFPIDLYFS